MLDGDDPRLIGTTARKNRPSDAGKLVVSRIFRTFGLAERRPALTHAVMAPLICLVLQQLDVQISLRRPRRADVAQPRGGEVERRLTVRKRAHDARAPSDLERNFREPIFVGSTNQAPTRAGRAA
jgi:hypothetical protein